MSASDRAEMWTTVRCSDSAGDRLTRCWGSGEWLCSVTVRACLNEELRELGVKMLISMFDSLNGSV